MWLSFLLSSPMSQGHGAPGDFHGHLPFTGETGVELGTPSSPTPLYLSIILLAPSFGAYILSPWGRCPEAYQELPAWHA